mmetsp:Transcript_73313/g.166184  ORF Transcript_73313/g.166184 Transcript_73313/m.166184 type:complete len:238 (-) Transcript_73313:124-837(-)
MSIPSIKPSFRRSVSCPDSGAHAWRAPRGLANQTAAKLQPWEERQARELYLAYDYDGNDSIDRTELQEMLMEQQWCMSASAIEEFIKMNVSSDVSEVNYELFKKLYAAMLAKQPASVRRKRGNGGGRITVQDMQELEATARQLFEAMDGDKTGYLSMEEMREVMREAGLPDADGDDYEMVLTEHMRIADANQDGQISFEEFVDYRNVVLANFFAQAEAARNLPPGAPDPWSPCLFCE